MSRAVPPDAQSKDERRREPYEQSEHVSQKPDEQSEQPPWKGWTKDRSRRRKRLDRAQAANLATAEHRIQQIEKAANVVTKHVSEGTNALADEWRRLLQ